jgi:hypothetical protein
MSQHPQRRIEIAPMRVVAVSGRTSVGGCPFLLQQLVLVNEVGRSALSAAWRYCVPVLNSRLPSLITQTARWCLRAGRKSRRAGERNRGMTGLGGDCCGRLMINSYLMIKSPLIMVKSPLIDVGIAPQAAMFHVEQRPSHQSCI